MDSGVDILRSVRTVTVVAFLVAAGCTTVRPPDYGVRQGQLAPCPKSRACVSSQAQDAGHFIEPLRYQSSRDDARQDLITAIHRFAQAHIVSSHRDYMRVEFPASAGNRRGNSEYYYVPEAAIDDVEFYLVPGERVIQVRAAARAGLLDEGENRARIEKLRSIFNALQDQRHRR